MQPSSCEFSASNQVVAVRNGSVGPLAIVVIANMQFYVTQKRDGGIKAKPIPYNNRHD